MDDFDAITAEFVAAERREHEEQARELLDEADAELRFGGLIRRVPVGEVVGLVLADGAALRGRIVRVGYDWVRVAEVADELGTARARSRRTHDVRLAAISRLTRDLTP